MASRGNTSNLPDQPNSNKTDNDLVEHIEIGPIKIELDASEDSESNDEMHTPSKMARLEENGSKRRTNKNHNHSYGESFGCSTDSEDTPGTLESDHTERSEKHKQSLGAFKLTPAEEAIAQLCGFYDSEENAEPEKNQNQNKQSINDNGNKTQDENLFGRNHKKPLQEERLQDLCGEQNALMARVADSLDAMKSNIAQQTYLMQQHYKRMEEIKLKKLEAMKYFKK